MTTFTNIRRLKLLKWVDLLLLFVISDCKLSMVGFWTVNKNKTSNLIGLT